jgi:hypothetical protein
MEERRNFCYHADDRCVSVLAGLDARGELDGSTVNPDTSWTRRLPAVSTALLLTTAQLAVLVSFVRPERAQPVDITGVLLLPQTPRPPPKPPPKPIVIDARRPAAAPRPATPPPAPAIGAPAQNQAPPGNTAITVAPPVAPTCPNPRADGAADCPPIAQKPESDEQLVIAPPPQVKNQEIWEEELARKNAPFALPGADGGLAGIIATLIFNPGAYADKRSWSYGVRPAAPPAPPGRARPTDEEFRKALAAANRRRGVKDPAAQNTPAAR